MVVVAVLVLASFSALPQNLYCDYCMLTLVLSALLVCACLVTVRLLSAK